MSDQRLFDLTSRDVLPAPDDDVLDPVGYDEVAVLVVAGQVPGAEPGAVDEGVGVGLGVLVPEKLLGPRATISPSWPGATS
jgi:hypothetical protein